MRLPERKGSRPPQRRRCSCKGWGGGGCRGTGVSGPQRLGFPRLRRSLERGDQVWEWAFPARWSGHRVLCKAALTPSPRFCERQKWPRPESQLSSGPARATRWLPLHAGQAPPGRTGPSRQEGALAGTQVPGRAGARVHWPLAKHWQAHPSAEKGGHLSPARQASGSRGEWRDPQEPLSPGRTLSRDEGGDCG